MRQSTFTPWSNFKTEGIFLFSKRTRNGSITNSWLSQIGTLWTSVERGSNGHTSSVLQLLPTALATLGPLWELRYNTIPGARNEASLFCRGLRGKVFTYFIYNHGSVQLLNTVHSPVLQSMLSSHAICSPSLGLAEDRGNKHTVVPVRNLPLEEVTMPVTDSEAASFLWRSVVIIAVRQVTCPPFKVETPQCASLDSSQPTVSRTPSPGAYRQKNKGVSYSEILCRHPHKSRSICTLHNAASVKLWILVDNIVFKNMDILSVCLCWNPHFTSYCNVNLNELLLSLSFLNYIREKIIKALTYRTFPRIHDIMWCQVQNTHLINDWNHFNYYVSQPIYLTQY